MRRQSATTWLVAIFVLALGAMGMARDLHAASHASSDGHHAICASEHGDTSPASLPLDSSDKGPECPTCDLLAVLSKSAISEMTMTVVSPSSSITAVDEIALTDPVVAQRLDANRTRGPPAVRRCAA